MSSMSKPMVKCRCCGHQIRGKEIMRTDLYEREPGRTYIYVKFRCRRCKRMGQMFVPEDRWDWGFLQPARDELSDVERDRLQDVGPISEAEILDFHLRLKGAAEISQLTGETPPADSKPAENSGKNKPAESKSEARDAKPRDSGHENARETRREGKNLNPGARESGGRDAKLNANGEVRPDDFSASS